MNRQRFIHRLEFPLAQFTIIQFIVLTFRPATLLPWLALGSNRWLFQRQQAAISTQQQ